jgi:tetratricopeptide (TPR) repeat protein
LLHLRRSGFRLQEAWIHRRDGGPRAREAKAILLALHYLDLLDFPEEAPSVDAEPVVIASMAAPRSATPLPELDAVHLFALALRFFKNGDLRHAQEGFESVARAEASNRQARAFLAWIHFCRMQGPERQAALDLTLKALCETVRAEPNFALGHYFIGELFKLRNEMTRAESAFRAAVRHDPDLIEAQRELRLINMRKTRR